MAKPEPEPEPVKDSPGAALADSLAAHREALRLRHAGKPVHARDALRHALRRRQDACTMDPDHVAACWQEERVPHRDFMTFYEEQLGE